ncbi:MAG TPA: TIM-barrel domain-containing protein [Parafilimonas sp.]
MKKIISFISLIILFCTSLHAQVLRQSFCHNNLTLSIETLSDSILHIQYKKGNASNNVIPVTDMIAKTNYEGSVSAKWSDNILETSALELIVNTATLSFEVIDKTKNNLSLTTIQPAINNDSLQGIKGACTNETAFYGLGEQFKENNSSINYKGKIKEGDQYGNRMMGFNGGGGPNIQMPIMYAIENASFKNYAVFVDDFLKQKFDLTNKDFWIDEVKDSAISFYFFSGENIRSLHKSFVELTGHPLMLPKKMFGLWVSEFGFDNWAEMEDKLRTLRIHKFPIDGFVFDLEWFGADQYKVRNDTMPLFEKVYMGRLAWDERNFPNPTQKLAQLKTEGIGTMVIQEPYVAKHLPEFDEYEKNNALVKDSSGKTGYIFQQPMWFSGPTGGGMFDYTNPAAGDYVFQHKILKLINMGLVGNWLDLGEPEHFQPWAKYYRGTHVQVNNMYAFLWEKSIYDGYKKYNVQARPFMMCRTGAPGMQRYGAIIWNGDPMLKIGNMMATGANLANLTLTGVFYYGTCAGGFYHRPDFGVDTGAFYTRWYAYSCLYDQPIWPHNFNPHNIPGDQAAPDRIGDMQSNLFATRQRYELISYYYSLAYKAYKEGETVYAPLLYYYQNDSLVKDLGNQIMIGEYMMGTIPDTYNGMIRKVYLPQGVWYNWHDLHKTTSKGEWIEVPYFRNDIFKLPLFAKEGAIIPLMYVDENTQNALGKREDNTIHNEFIVRIFPSIEKTDFTEYDDDGQTINYLNGEYATTNISQQLKNKTVEIIINSAEGNYKPVASRNNIVEVVIETPVTSVELNNKPLPLIKSEEAFNKSAEGYINLNGMVKCKSAKLDVDTNKKFVLHF